MNKVYPLDSKQNLNHFGKPERNKREWQHSERLIAALNKRSIKQLVERTLLPPALSYLNVMKRSVLGVSGFSFTVSIYLSIFFGFSFTSSSLCSSFEVLHAEVHPLPNTRFEIKAFRNVWPAFSVQSRTHRQHFQADRDTRTQAAFYRGAEHAPRPAKRPKVVPVFENGS